MSPGPEVFEVLSKAGIGLESFADPETRVGVDTVMELLARAVARANDPALGVRAGEGIEPGDLDPLDWAARRCDTLGDAISCVQRYFCLMNESATVALEERGEHAVWSYTAKPGAKHHPAANDFVVTFAVLFARRYAGVTSPNTEVHLAHAEPTDAAAYARAFRTTVKLGMPRNAIIFPKVWLQLPMANANSALNDGFERLAPELTRKYRTDITSGRVRELLREGLAYPKRSMHRIARQLAMSVATLRRRLEEEGTTLTQLLDDERRELALRYVADGRTPIDIAFLLGYRSENAARRALKQWENEKHAKDPRTRGRRRPRLAH